jgi:hypothetical protein
MRDPRGSPVCVGGVAVSVLAQDDTFDRQRVAEAQRRLEQPRKVVYVLDATGPMITQMAFAKVEIMKAVEKLKRKISSGW